MASTIAWLPCMSQSLVNHGLIRCKREEPYRGLATCHEFSWRRGVPRVAHAEKEDRVPSLVKCYLILRPWSQEFHGFQHHIPRTGFLLKSNQLKLSLIDDNQIKFTSILKSLCYSNSRVVPTRIFLLKIGVAASTGILLAISLHAQRPCSIWYGSSLQNCSK